MFWPSLPRCRWDHRGGRIFEVETNSVVATAAIAGRAPLWYRIPHVSATTLFDNARGMCRIYFISRITDHGVFRCVRIFRGGELLYLRGCALFRPHSLVAVWLVVHLDQSVCVWAVPLLDRSLFDRCCNT